MPVGDGPGFRVAFENLWVKRRRISGEYDYYSGEQIVGINKDICHYKYLAGVRYIIGNIVEKYSSNFLPSLII